MSAQIVDRRMWGDLLRLVRSVLVWQNIFFPLKIGQKLNKNHQSFMQPWRKNIAVKLPPFLAWSASCSNFGHVTLTRWVSKSFFGQEFGPKKHWKCVKKILLKMSMISLMCKHCLCHSWRYFWCHTNTTFLWFYIA